MRWGPFLLISLFAAFVLTTLLTPSSSAQDDGLAELKKFQGTWECVEIISRGESIPVKGKNKFTVIITDKDITYIDPEGNKQRMMINVKMIGKEVLVVLSEGKDERVQLVLNATTTPKSLYYAVWGPYGPMVEPKGIYKLEGDTLWWCLSKDQPKEFSSTKGSDQTLIKLKRIKS